MRYLLRFTYKQHEWGFYRHYIPQVGDSVNLPYSLPDQKSDDWIEATVVKREFYLEDGAREFEEIWLIVEAKAELGDEYVADSELWPSEKWTELQNEANRRLGRLGESGK